MNVLVIGSGGREHAIVKKLKESPRVERLYALPGNGGMAADAVCLPGNVKDIPGLVRAAQECGADFVVVAPDDPLALGAVDALHAAGFRCFGPDAKAAAIESSKVFSKDLMRKYHIPTADYRVFDEPAAALDYLSSAPIPIVVKADGLALGKGALVCMTRQEAEDAVHAMMEDKVFGESGSRVVIEEFLEGPEVSVLSFTDGEAVVPMVSSMDHKRALDGDQGLNTGGMGTIAPNPYYTPEVAQVCMDTIFLPTIRAMAAEGRPFKGCLYFGLMLTKNGPKVIEYNCRFGDPETQVVLPLLESDLLTVMEAVEAGKLADCPVKFSAGAACCVVAASKGYPGKYDTGYPITMTEEARAHAYVAGVKLREDSQLVTSGGRVLGITAAAAALPDAIREAYRLMEGVQFENRYFRRDIGGRALAALEGKN